LAVHTELTSLIAEAHNEKERPTVGTPLV